MVRELKSKHKIKITELSSRLIISLVCSIYTISLLIKNFKISGSIIRITLIFHLIAIVSLLIYDLYMCNKISKIEQKNNENLP
jgi:hypothetical protein